MIIGFFEEAAGQRSATRLVFVIGSLWIMVLVSYLAWKGTAPTELLALFSGMLVVLCGLKLGQKAMEPKDALSIQQGQSTPEPPKA